MAGQPMRDLDRRAVRGARDRRGRDREADLDRDPGARGSAAGSAPGWSAASASVPRPERVRRRLAAIGAKSISAAVDATNYVLWDTSQPLHAFDFDKLAGGVLIVRKAQRGEKLVTLDGVERVLETSDVVVADADRAVSLAGIMGGLDTAVTPHDDATSCSRRRGGTRSPCAGPRAGSACTPTPRTASSAAPTSTRSRERSTYAARAARRGRRRDDRPRFPRRPRQP